MRILVIEPDKNLAALIKRGLIQEGYITDTVFSAGEAKEHPEIANYDLIILDSNSPMTESVELSRELRDSGVNVLILMLIAREYWEDRLACYESGADDCFVKPFNFKEFLVRVHTLLKRVGNASGPKLQVGDLVLDAETHEIKYGEKPIILNNKEFNILEYFMRYPNKVISRTVLMQHIWDLGFDSDSNLIDVYIARIRKKIDQPGKESLIQTIKGSGYILKEAKELVQ